MACEGIYGNQLANCGFEVGAPPAGWEVLLGHNFFQEQYGKSGQFSAGLYPAAPVISIWGTNLASACFAPQVGRLYRYGASVRYDHPQSVGHCLVRWAAHSSVGCEDPPMIVGSSPTASVVPGQWIDLASSVTPAAPFARLQVYCSYLRYSVPIVIDDAFAAPVASVVEIPMLAPGVALLLVVVLGLLAIVMVRRRHSVNDVRSLHH